jgi:SAM-dependent methyltransferase
MSFPWHDPPWREVGDLLESETAPGERVLAPDLFWWRLPELWRYVPANVGVDATYDWVVVHKGELPAIPRPFLEHVVATMTPVLANEVFVVFAARPEARRVDPQSPHVLSFLNTLAHLPAEPEVEHPVVSDRVLDASALLPKFGAMTRAEARAEQDEFFAGGGYRYPTGRDAAYFAETRGHRDRVLRPGTRVLDLGSGSFPAAPIPEGVTFVRSDFSRVGVARSRQVDAGEPGVTYLVCDAEAAAVASSAFDMVLFVDSIEHVFDAAAVVFEASRALRPGGEFLVTFSNSNSLNQILTRALGYPTFLTNHQHICEFTPDEMLGMLDAAGFDVVETAGIELRPYWGVPGIDHLVREAVDEDEELIGALQELGRRAGFEYAYVGVILARKRS